MCARPGQLGDEALKAAIRKTKAGADEGDILAAQQGAIFAGGGDYPANEFIIGSGRDALLVPLQVGPPQALASATSSRSSGRASTVTTTRPSCAR